MPAGCIVTCRLWLCMGVQKKTIYIHPISPRARQQYVYSCSVQCFQNGLLHQIINALKAISNKSRCVHPTLYDVQVQNNLAEISLSYLVQCISLQFVEGNEYRAYIGGTILVVKFPKNSQFVHVFSKVKFVSSPPQLYPHRLRLHEYHYCFNLVLDNKHESSNMFVCFSLFFLHN